MLVPGSSWRRARRFAYVWRQPFSPLPIGSPAIARPMQRRQSRPPYARRGGPSAWRGGVASRLAAARSACPFSAAIVLVDGGPGATFSLLLRNAAAFVALLDMLRLPFLLVGVCRFVSPWHGFLLRCATKIPCVNS